MELSMILGREIDNHIEWHGVEPKLIILSEWFMKGLNEEIKDNVSHHQKELEFGNKDNRFRGIELLESKDIEVHTTIL